MTKTLPFLRASWKNLAVLNYEIAPRVLTPYLPRGTEIDAINGKTYISIVSFLFLDSRLLGIPVPGHGRFEEVNLRFYVCSNAGGEIRRGVVFIKELVPRRAVALAARYGYGENYHALPMTSRIEMADSGEPTRVRYQWQQNEKWNFLSVTAAQGLRNLTPGSSEESLLERYWGYTKKSEHCTWECRVAHPPWRVWDVEQIEFECDVAGIFGRQFAPFISGTPSSAILADGSEVAVYFGRRIARRDAAGG